MYSNGPYNRKGTAVSNRLLGVCTRSDQLLDGFYYVNDSSFVDLSMYK